MSWIRWLRGTTWPGRELDALDRRLRRVTRHRSRERASSAQVERRLAELEDDLERLSLLSCALLQIGLEKGAFSRDELQARLDQLDASDGRTDGKLAPDWLRAEEGGGAAGP